MGRSENHSVVWQRLAELLKGLAFFTTKHVCFLVEFTGDDDSATNMVELITGAGSLFQCLSSFPYQQFAAAVSAFPTVAVSSSVGIETSVARL